MNREDVLLSLCIPTNGITEWVKEVLDSIYDEKNPSGNFEVIVTDNGSNLEFAELMHQYVHKYDNLVYQKTDAQMFLNQIEAFKLAKGSLIKFVNHRMKLLPGALNYLIEFARQNRDTKPVTYFSNGKLNLAAEQVKCRNFDQYVRTLSYWSSWSAGTMMWKNDFDDMDLSRSYNALFPHTDFVFFKDSADKYIIDNRIIMEEIPTLNTKKGKYDLFNAFAVEYVNILEKLKNDGSITVDTYSYVKEQNGHFVSSLYYEYVVKGIPCSYDLSGYDAAIECYYSHKMVQKDVFRYRLSSIKNRIMRVIH